MIAAVRSVTAARTLSASRQKWSGSMSAKTGVAPVRATELAVAAKVKDGHDDLVARADAGGQQTEVQRGGARVDRDARATARRPCCANSSSKAATSGPWAIIPSA